MVPPKRHEPASVLHKEGIPCVVWFEDAVAHYGVPTVVFDLYLLVPDIDAAAQVLVERGWSQAKAQSSKYHFLSQHPDIRRRRLEPPGGTEPKISEPRPWPPLPPTKDPPRPTTTVLLSADDWKFPPERLACSLTEGPFPQLCHLVDSLIESILDWDHHIPVEDHLSVHISYLYEYVAKLKERSFVEGLKFENRQFHHDILSGLRSGTIQFRAHER